MNSHSSRTTVTDGLKRPTRIQRGPRQWISIWPCSKWGLPCHDMLPCARCALTAPPTTNRVAGGLSLLPFRDSRPQALPGLCPVSPDFPPARRKTGQRLSDSPSGYGAKPCSTSYPANTRDLLSGPLVTQPKSQFVSLFFSHATNLRS